MCRSRPAWHLDFFAVFWGGADREAVVLDVAGDMAVSFFLVVTFRPARLGLGHLVGRGHRGPAAQARRRRPAARRSSAGRVLAAGGAVEAGSALANWNFPSESSDMTTSFSSASRARKSQSVTLA